MKFSHARGSIRLSYIQRSAWLLAILGGALASPSSAMQEPSLPPSAPHSAPAADRTTRDEAMLQRLESTIIDVAYDRLDFEKIIQDLRETHKLNIHVSWAELETAGVRRDQRIEMRLEQVSLATMLDLLLREAAAGTNAAGEIAFHVESGVLVIDLGEVRREQTIVRMYDVTDLLESGYAIRRFANTPVLGMKLTGREFVGGQAREEPTSRGGGGGGGFGGGGGGESGSGGSIFGEAGDDPGRPTIMERIDNLISLLTESVDPSDWDIAGGEIASVRAMESTLIIHHTLQGHQRLAAFLAMLRESRPQPVNADVAIVRLRADKAAELRKAAGGRFPILSADALDALAFEATSSGVLFRASTSGAAGKAMLLSALTQREAMVTANAIIGDQAVGYVPQSQTSTAGLELIILPLIQPASEKLTLDVQMAIVPPAIVSQRPVRLGPGEAESTIDQVQRSMRTVSSQTALMLGDTLALTIPQEVNPQAATAEFEDWLLVRVRKAD